MDPLSLRLDPYPFFKGNHIKPSNSFQDALYSRRRSVHFVSDHTTVIVPGSEEKEYRGRGEGPAARAKEVHPGGIDVDLSEESEGEGDEEERLRLSQAREAARRQSEPVFMSRVKKKASSRVRSPPPLMRRSLNQADEEDEDEEEQSITKDLNSKASLT